MEDKKETLSSEILPEIYKGKGNASFQEGNYLEAVEYYSMAINASISATNASNENLHVYYSNRALCNIRLENYGSAIIDAEASIDLCPTYSKAYYRRGVAYLNLFRYSLAKKDFLTVLSLTENDKEAYDKAMMCTKLIKQEKFLSAISTDRSKMLHETITLDSQRFTVPNDYDGPRYIQQSDNQIKESNLSCTEDTTHPKFENLSMKENKSTCQATISNITLDNGSFLNGLIDYIKIPGNRLHIKYAYAIVLDVIKVLKETAPKPLVHINLGKKEHITVCGDIHGQFYDLLNIFDINGLPSESNGYIFNGDFVDRGSFSVEVILVLFTLKIMFPYHVHLARGNHETRNLNKLYGFEGEILAKYDSTLYDLISEAFCFLPLVHIINNKVFIVHGGLCTEDNVKLKDIEQLYTKCEPGDSGIMSSLLWSDPHDRNGRSPSPRGVGCNFGPDITQKFLQDNNLDYIIRSHEVKQEGYSVDHNGNCITVFSAPNYCDSMGNKGALVKIHEHDLKPNFVQFSAAPHPPVPAMKYANPMLSYSM
ncbi:serine threonine protein phosphatase [Cryptosporidium andersoni]|uniref:Serine/threonine-protein phosphatase T n=1 Tax=Cryptosporidium andersoni TaxID=117008 RepID=A0A1J4MN70_9CRYT|nr:serine threonine protein phosphatase [Cryptosporidium andersoni]